MAFGAALALAPAVACAIEPSECADAAERGQKLRDSRKLLDARAAFTMCARPECPKVVVRDCTTWVERTTADIPKLVPRAKDEGGHDLTTVRVLVDGVVATQQINGRRIPIDPGAHVVRFEADGREPYEEKVVLSEAEQYPLTVTLREVGKPPAPAPKPAELPMPADGASGPPTLTYVLGALSIAAFAGFGYFAATGTSDANALRDGCGKTTGCARTDLDAVRGKYLVADIFLTGGVLALGGAVAVWLLRPSTTTASSTTLRLTAGPGSASLAGSF